MNNGDIRQGNSERDAARKRLGAVLIGLLLGELAGGSASTVARLVLFVKDGSGSQQWAVDQATLVVLFFFTMAGATFGFYMARRGWAEYEQVILSVAAAVVVALFTILKINLPPVTGEANRAVELRFFETSYYVIWAAVLLILPPLILPGPRSDFSRFVRLGAALVATTAACALTGFVVGHLVQGGYGLAAKTDWLAALVDGPKWSGHNDWHKIWVASPATLDPIAGAFLAVAFAPLWWPIFRQNSSRAVQIAWTISFSTFAVFWSGIFGGQLFAHQGRSWAGNLIEAAPDAVTPFHFFVFFAAFPAVFAAVVWGAHRLSRKRSKGQVAGWNAKGRFWLLCAIGLSVGFAAISWLILGPLMVEHGASTSQVALRSVLHGINGLALVLVVLGLNVIVRLSAGDGAGTPHTTGK